MSKLYLALVFTLTLFALIMLLSFNLGNFLNTSVTSAQQGDIIVCSHVSCADTTEDGIGTNCRRTVVKCTSQSCNAGPCITPPPAASPSPSLNQVPVVSPSLILVPVNPTPDLNASPTVIVETEDDELKLLRELWNIIVSLFRKLGQIVLEFLDRL